METFIAWIQDNHLPLLGAQLAVVLAVALWIGLRRIRATAASAEAHEPAEGDRRTVVLPEEDAAQMFETLTALQEELELYRKPGVASRMREAEPRLQDEPGAVEELNPVHAQKTVEVNNQWDVEEEAASHAVTEETPTNSDRPETEPVEEASPADRVLRSWLEDVEQLARRARRDSL